MNNVIDPIKIKELSKQNIALKVNNFDSVLEALELLLPVADGSLGDYIAAQDFEAEENNRIGKAVDILAHVRKMQNKIKI